MVERLERLSADSAWAHRASGLRGALIRALDNDAGFVGGTETEYFTELVKHGYQILNEAARQIPDTNDNFQESN